MSNCIIDNLKNFKALSPISQHIVRHDISEVDRQNVFNNLMQDAVECGATTSQEFYEFLRPFEEEILQIRLNNGERVQTKKGKWLYTKTTSTSTYRSNKAVIGKSLDAGIPLVDGKVIRGKTALEKLRKEKTTTIMLPSDKAGRAVVTITRVWPELDTGEREVVKNLINTLED